MKLEPRECLCGAVETFVEQLDSTQDGGWYAQCSGLTGPCNANTPDMPTREATIRVWNAMQAEAAKEAKSP